MQWEWWLVCDQELGKRGLEENAQWWGSRSVLLIEYHPDDKNENDEMGWESIMSGKEERYIQGFGGETRDKQATL